MSRLDKLDGSQLQSTAADGATNTTATNPNSNKMPITFFFKNAVKELTVYMTLRNLDKTDVRKYRVVINCLPKPIKAQMEMMCPARESVVQEIPIVNPSDRDWTIKVGL